MPTPRATRWIIAASVTVAALGLGTGLALAFGSRNQPAPVAPPATVVTTPPTVVTTPPTASPTVPPRRATTSNRTTRPTTRATTSRPPRRTGPAAFSLCDPADLGHTATTPDGVPVQCTHGTAGDLPRWYPTS
jgi:hypothetical protein